MKANHSPIFLSRRLCSRAIGGKEMNFSFLIESGIFVLTSCVLSIRKKKDRDKKSNHVTRKKSLGISVCNSLFLTLKISRKYPSLPGFLKNFAYWKNKTHISLAQTHPAQISLKDSKSFTRDYYILHWSHCSLSPVEQIEWNPSKLHKGNSELQRSQ